MAEPAGPIDPEAAKRAAEEYAQKCIVPQVEVLMTMGIAPGPPPECTAQVNGTVTTTETSSPFNLYFADSYGTTP